MKQLGNRVGLYADNNLVTVFENKNIRQAADWIFKNLKAKIHIAK